MNSKNKKEETLTWIIKVLGIVEQGIGDKVELIEIKRRIQDQIPYNYNYFATMFHNLLGYSLAEYIRDEYLLHAYGIWKRENKILKQRENYEGIPYFLFNFQRRFGVSLEKAQSIGGIKLEQKISQKELITIKESLENLIIVDNYEIKEGNVNIEFDVEMIVLFVLQQKSYIIPEWVVDGSSWGNISKESKKILLLSCDKLKENPNNCQVTLSMDEIERMSEVLELYDLKVPTRMNGQCIYSIILKDAFRPAFEEVIKAYLNMVIISYPMGDETPKKYIEVVNAINKCGGLLTIQRLAKKSGKTEYELMDNLWEMAKKGLLKIKLGE